MTGIGTVLPPETRDKTEDGNSTGTGGRVFNLNQGERSCAADVAECCLSAEGVPSHELTSMTCTMP